VVVVVVVVVVVGCYGHSECAAVCSRQWPQVVAQTLARQVQYT
jgi:hypothetical protein